MIASNDVPSIAAELTTIPMWPWRGGRTNPQLVASFGISYYMLLLLLLLHPNNNYSTNSHDANDTDNNSNPVMMLMMLIIMMRMILTILITMTVIIQKYELKKQQPTIAESFYWNLVGSDFVCLIKTYLWNLDDLSLSLVISLGLFQEIIWYLKWRDKEMGWCRCFVDQLHPAFCL